MYHSIDELLYETNRVAKAPTVEDLRESVTRNLISVYKKVDAPTLWQGAVHHYETSTVSSLKLPPYCIVPLSLVQGKFSWSEFNETGNFSGDFLKDYGHRIVGGMPLNFAQSGDQLFMRQFFSPNLTYTIAGSLTLSYWRIPLDEAGAPMVDDRIWEAAVLSCQAEEARIGLHGRNTQSYSATPYQVDKQLANQAIDAARAFCNRMTPNNWRQFFEAFPTNQPMR